MQTSLWTAFSRTNHQLFPLLEKTFIKGRGAYLWDKEGHKYFDGFSTLWTNLIGHCNEEVVEVIHQQLKTLSFMHLFSGTTHEPAIELTSQLVEKSPFDHKHCFYGTSGSDATETALKLARLYWFSQGRQKKNIIVGRLQEYHGTSFGALSLMGWDSYQTPYKPLVGHTHRVPPCNCYHCPDGLSYPSCSLSCTNHFRDYFEQINAKENVAAILIEPIISSDGLITPPEGYWKEIEKMCKEYEVLIIADEVSTGMGRTGLFYASSHYGLTPDILYMAKSLTSGYSPLSVTMTSSKIYDSINAHSFFTHGTTFGGHPVSCVAASKVLEILFRDNLIQKAQELGDLLFQCLLKELLPLPVVGNIRAKGLLCEIELVKEKETKEAPTDEISLSMHLYHEALKRGCYIRPLGRFICVAPPLISTKEEIEKLCQDLQKTIKAVMDRKELWP